MLRPLPVTLSVVALLALPAAGFAHPLPQHPNVVGTGHPAPPRTGFPPQGGSGYNGCKPGWFKVGGKYLRVWCS